jgi:bifunctional non-homologous end joining protein LigD
VVFPAVGRTKGDVVRYYEQIAPRLLPHVIDRPLSIRRFPKGLAGPGFFQKNIPDHYPPSFGRLEVPRSAAASKKHPRHGTAADVTVYPVVKEAEHLPYLGNQGAIELHVPTSRIASGFRPDRIVIDLDPPEGALAAVRQAAKRFREALDTLGLATVPVATGSKGYHLVAPIAPRLDGETIALATQKLAALLVAGHPEEVTTVFRMANRGGRVFIDWMRNNPGATIVAPYSVRARPRASVAIPLTWDEIEVHAPDAFTIDDVEALRERADPLAELSAKEQDAESFVSAVDAAVAPSGLVLEPFDRFRS